MSIFTWKFWTISLYCASQCSNQRNYKKEDSSTYENIKILNNYSKRSAL